MLIAFEGTDGTGKSTQAKLLYEHLRTQGVPCVLTGEPTSGEYGTAIRRILRGDEEASKEEIIELFMRDRHEHVENVIRPSLDEGKVVITDRYWLSTMVYQSLAGFSSAYLWNRQKTAPFPQVTFVLYGDPWRLMRQIRLREGKPLESYENPGTLTKVNELYKSYADVPSFFLHKADDFTIGSLHEVIRGTVETARMFELMFNIPWTAQLEFEKHIGYNRATPKEKLAVGAAVKHWGYSECYSGAVVGFSDCGRARVKKADGSECLVSPQNLIIDNEV